MSLLRALSVKESNAFHQNRWYSNIYILGVFTEKPYSKPLESNVVYISIITLSHATSYDFKWRQSKPWLSTIWLDVGDVMTPLTLLVEKLSVNVFLLQFYIRFFVNVLIEMNVNVSNELNFSDVYRSVNYIGSLAKFTWTPSSFTLHATQCSLHFDKPQKNEIHSLNITTMSWTFWYALYKKKVGQWDLIHWTYLKLSYQGYLTIVFAQSSISSKICEPHHKNKQKQSGMCV